VSKLDKDGWHHWEMGSYVRKMQAKLERWAAKLERWE
jgi:hypothetical protein